MKRAADRATLCVGEKTRPVAPFGDEPLERHHFPEQTDDACIEAATRAVPKGSFGKPFGKPQSDKRYTYGMRIEICVNLLRAPIHADAHCQALEAHRVHTHHFLDKRRLRKIAQNLNETR